MGFDVSYHPVDSVLIDTIVAPYLLDGSPMPESLTANAVRIALNRFRANAWGLGVTRIQHDRFVEQQGQSRRKGLLSRLFGRNAEVAPGPPDFEFDTDLFVWGRPFFITDAGPSQVSSRIDEYLACEDMDSVDLLARQMVDTISPGLIERVSLSSDDEAPTHEEARNAVFWKLDLLREAVINLPSGRTIRTPDGDDVPPAELLGAHLPLAVMEFAAHFRPGWMDRGYVWPTLLLKKAGLPLMFFEPPVKLFASLSERLPGVTLHLDNTITENYMPGGYVQADRVPELRHYIREHRQQILAPAAKDGWQDGCSLSLRKLDEALFDAELRGLPFVEATEIYSAPFGMLN